VLNLVLKFCKNLGFSLSGHCEWGTRAFTSSHDHTMIQLSSNDAINKWQVFCSKSLRIWALQIVWSTASHTLHTLIVTVRSKLNTGHPNTRNILIPDIYVCFFRLVPTSLDRFIQKNILCTKRSI
jgi:hypothetical protein